MLNSSADADDLVFARLDFDYISITMQALNNFVCLDLVQKAHISNKTGNIICIQVRRILFLSLRVASKEEKHFYPPDMTFNLTIFNILILYTN